MFARIFSLEYVEYSAFFITMTRVPLSSVEQLLYEL